jgi:hypothetical protein
MYIRQLTQLVRAFKEIDADNGNVYILNEKAAVPRGWIRKCQLAHCMLAEMAGVKVIDVLSKKYLSSKDGQSFEGIDQNDDVWSWVVMEVDDSGEVLMRALANPVNPRVIKRHYTEAQIATLQEVLYQYFDGVLGEKLHMLNKTHPMYDAIKFNVKERGHAKR